MNASSQSLLSLEMPARKESEIIRALNNKPIIDSEFMKAIKSKPKRDPDMVEVLKNLNAIEWEKEAQGKEWNTRAKELNAKTKDKKGVKAIHKSIFG